MKGIDRDTEAKDQFPFKAIRRTFLLKNQAAGVELTTDIRELGWAGLVRGNGDRKKNCSPTKPQKYNLVLKGLWNLWVKHLGREQPQGGGGRATACCRVVSNPSRHSRGVYSPGESTNQNHSQPQHTLGERGR